MTSMYNMFYYCPLLKSLDLSNFDTSSVTNMSHMFDGSQQLTSLNLTGFDASKVTTMDYMFNDCIRLEKIDLSDFKTSCLTSTQFMFNNCTAATEIKFSEDFDTSNVINMYGMFCSCTSLTSLDLSSFDTSNVETMDSMFYGCTSLTSLNLSSFDTSIVESMNGIFEGCESLTTLDLTNIDFTKVSDVTSMFKDCTSLETIYVASGIDLSGVSGTDYMFEDCTSLTGENGTTYSETYIDGTYAHVDTAETPGYFSVKKLDASSILEQGVFQVELVYGGYSYLIQMTNDGSAITCTKYMDNEEDGGDLVDNTQNVDLTTMAVASISSGTYRFSFGYDVDEDTNEINGHADLFVVTIDTTASTYTLESDLTLKETSTGSADTASLTSLKFSTDGMVFYPLNLTDATRVSS